MAVGTWIDPNFEGTPPNNDGTSYKTALDNSIAVAKRIVDAYAPHAKTTPDMNVLVDAGAKFNDNVITENLQQTVGPITAPVTNSRIDRIVTDKLTGIASRIAGTEAGSPVAPAITEEKDPCCRIALGVGQTSIVNANITDERIGGGGGGVIVKDKITTNAVFTDLNENALYSKSISGGLLGTNNAVILYIGGKINQSGGLAGQSITFRFKYGVTTMVSIIAIASADTVAAHSWGAIVMLSGDGATNAQIMRVFMFLQSDVSATAFYYFDPSEVQSPSIVKSGTATEDSTAAKTLAVTADAALSTSQSMSMDYAMLQKAA